MIKIPSKCLISGGHSIWKENNKGISLSIESYYYTDYKIIKKDNIESKIILINKNLKNNDYEFLFNNNSFEIKGEKNKFIDSVINVLTKIIKKFDLKLKYDYKIELYFDKFFFSLSNKNSKIDLKTTPKNGLGSSCCFIVCLMKTLLKIFNFNYDFDREFLLYACLLVNYYSQNKIGSGFDIQTCIYGTHLFINKNSKKLKDFEDHLINNKNFVFEKIEIKRLFINEYYKLLMVEVIKGTDTINQVKSWKTFFENNEELKNKFYKISNEITDLIYNNQKDLLLIKKENLNYRNFIKEISIKSGVELEPDIITKIIGIIENKIEVVYSIAPGAGGYDSIAFIIKKKLEIDLINLKKEISPLLEIDFNLFILNIN